MLNLRETRQYPKDSDFELLFIEELVGIITIPNPSISQ